MSGDEATLVKTKRSRASTFSPVWNYFTKGNKNGQFYQATCVFCSHKFTWGKAGEMINHIRSKCRMATVEAKAEAELMESPAKPRKSTDLYTARSSVQEALAAFARNEVKIGSAFVPRSSQSASATYQRRTRLRKPVWSFFHVGKAYHNSHSAKCRYCGKEYAAGIPETLVNHIVKRCPSAPLEIREAFIEDPSGQRAMELNVENSSIDADVDVQWELSGGSRDAVSELLAVDDQSESDQSAPKESVKKKEKTLPEGLKPGIGQAGMGRSRNSVWEHFETGVKRGYFYEIFCKYCGYTNQTGVPVKMIEHLKTKCPNVPEDVKKEKFHRPERRGQEPPTPQSHGYPPQIPEQNGKTISELRSRTGYLAGSSSWSEFANGDVATRAVGLAALPRSMRRGASPEVGPSMHCKRIRRAIPIAPSPTRPTTGLGVVEEKFHQSLSRYFVMTGRSPSLLEHPAFRQLLLSLNPSLTIPSPQYLAEVIMECEIIRVDSLTEASVEAAVFVTLGVGLIGHAARCSVLVILVSCIDENGKKKSFVRSVHQVPGSSGTDLAGTATDEDVFRWVSDRVNEQIEEIGPRKIVAVVDFGEARSASILPRHVASVPCILQCLDKLLQGVIQQKYAVDLADSCQRIASCINAEAVIQEKFAEHGGKPWITLLPTATVECMQSILHHQSSIRKAMTEFFGEFNEDLSLPFVMRFVESDEFWQQLEGIMTVVAPLVSAISLSRKEAITLGDFFYFLLAHGRRLSSGSRKGVAVVPVEVNRSCVLNLNSEFAKVDSPVLRLSYLLHPLYRGDGLFDCLPDELLLEAGEWSKSMGRTAEETLTMIRQLRRFKCHLPPFNETFRATDCPITFWQRLSPAAGLELRQLAIRLLAICPTTAIAGPQWNSAALAKKSRTLSPEILQKVVQLQHFYFSNAAEEFKELKTLFGNSTNQQKVMDFMRTEAEEIPFSKNFNFLKNEPPDSDQEDEPSLCLDAIVDLANPIFDNMPKSWILQKSILKMEESPAAQTSFEEYDVRKLLSEIDED